MSEILLQTKLFLPPQLHLVSTSRKDPNLPLARLRGTANLLLSLSALKVLKLLATGLTGPEIARELMVSINTLRTHTKNLYAKLGVKSRRSAVRRAEALNLP